MSTDIVKQESTSLDLNTEDPKVSLPSINIVLEKIEHYQNQQKLSDSQLLLELTQRQPSQQDGIQTPDLSRKSTPTYSTTPTPPPTTANPPTISTQPPGNPYNFQSNSYSSFINSKPNEPLCRSDENTISNFPKGMNKQIQLTPKTADGMSRVSSYDSLDSSMKSGSNTPSLVSLDGSSFSSKKRTNLPRETIEILNDWILNNMDNPYPSHSQKRLLLEKTGLSNVQLSNWFINKRRRRIFSKLSGNNGQPIKKKRLIDRI